MTTVTAPTTTPVATRNVRVLRAGLTAGAIAAITTTGFAAVTHAAGVSYAIKGQAIPALGFGQMTFLFSLVGVGIAAVLARRARHAQSTFIRSTVALTLLSFVPDIVAQTGSLTKVSLMTSHVLAAAVVIPRLAARLND